MIWVLSQNDPKNLLSVASKDWDLITYNDGPFKTCLDRTKYRPSFKDVQIEVERKITVEYRIQLNNRLTKEYILG